MKLISALGLVGVMGAASVAQADTFATFADPAANGTTPLFAWNGTTSTLSGGWNSTGLNILTPVAPAPDFPNAKFTLNPIVASSVIGGIATFGPGSIDFFDSGNNPIFTIAWASATLNTSLSFGGSDFIGNNVTFSGPILVGLNPSAEAFSFSFANPVGNAQNFTVTAAFTSSADGIIPAPGALALVGLGGLVATRRRR